MLNFVPNIVVLDYLTSVNQLTPEIKSKAIGYMETGYQKELTYKHNDGSYSAFGKSDRSGSTWLTAFVARSFNQASKYIQIDKDIVNQALHFLSQKQLLDGRFPEVGSMLSKSMQGGASDGIELTAYALITFLENKEHSQQYQSTIDEALKYIESKMRNVNETYAIAITTYALQLANHSAKDEMLAKLDKMSINENGMKFWKRSDLGPEFKRPNSINIEMTAYALLAFLEAGRNVESISIMKWLVTQRNENGGFQSTQDTIVGLQALAKLSSKIYSDNNDVRVSVKSLESNAVEFHINSENSLVLQKQELPSKSRNFQITASGNGFSVLQISYRYNVPIKMASRFSLKPKVKEASNKEFLHLSICTKFIADSLNKESNMAVMEVTLPSGFTFDSDHLPTLKSFERVKVNG
jgi:CD109 antigen